MIICCCSRSVPYHEMPSHNTHIKYHHTFYIVFCSLQITRFKSPLNLTTSIPLCFSPCFMMNGMLLFVAMCLFVCCPSINPISNVICASNDTACLLREREREIERECLLWIVCCSLLFMLASLRMFPELAMTVFEFFWLWLRARWWNAMSTGSHTHTLCVCVRGLVGVSVLFELPIVGMLSVLIYLMELLFPIWF